MLFYSQKTCIKTFLLYKMLLNSKGLIIRAEWSKLKPVFALDKKFNSSQNFNNRNFSQIENIINSLPASGGFKGGGRLQWVNPPPPN